MAKKYDKYLTISIVTNQVTYSESFNTEANIKDSISWLKSSFSINDDSIVSITVSYVSRYKRSLND